MQTEGNRGRQRAPPAGAGAGRRPGDVARRAHTPLRAAPGPPATSAHPAWWGVGALDVGSVLAPLCPPLCLCPPWTSPLPCKQNRLPFACPAQFRERVLPLRRRLRGGVGRMQRPTSGVGAHRRSRHQVNLDASEH
eukprot:gene12649-biopygen4956